MANELYTVIGTEVTWNDTTAATTLALNNLGTGAGVFGDIRDWGASPRPTRYHFKMVVQFATAPVVGETVRLFIVEYGIDATAQEGTNDDGTTAGAISSTDKLRNLLHVGTLVVDEAATSVDMSIEGTFETMARHFHPAVFNDTADNLVATNDISYVAITPIAIQVQ